MPSIAPTEAPVLVGQGTHLQHRLQGADRETEMVCDVTSDHTFQKGIQVEWKGVVCMDSSPAFHTNFWTPNQPPLLWDMLRGA
jgi:hypothetical protein